MAPRILAAAAVVVGLLAAGCGDAATTTTAVPATATPPATTAPPAATTPPATSGAPTTAPTTAAPAPTTTRPAPAPTTTDAIVFEVAVADGRVVGGMAREAVELGASVEIVVTSDAPDEVHVHGYDAFADVAPGAPARVELTADIPGVFEVELEDARLPLLELEVS